MTDIALVTTTIYVPHLLKKVREVGPDVAIFIAGDMTSPHDEIAALCSEIGNAEYLAPGAGASYDCSQTIGWHSIQRRNIALLEAIRSGAEIIYLWDDDNEVLDGHFEAIARLLSGPQPEVHMVTARGGWFNPGCLAGQPYTKRGYPYSKKLERVSGPEIHGPARQAQIGVAEGLIFGDPDCNATERIERAPLVEDYDLPEPTQGVALHPSTTWAPLNSQNTAWRRELAPLAFVLPGVGRYDDILGGYIAQKVMSVTPYCTHFGAPLVVQRRHPHDFLRDLEGELWGMRNLDEFLLALEGAPVKATQGVVDNLAAAITHIRHWFMVKERFQAATFLRDWVYDLEKALT